MAEGKTKLKTEQDETSAESNNSAAAAGAGAKQDETRRPRFAPANMGGDKDNNADSKSVDDDGLGPDDDIDDGDDDGGDGNKEPEQKHPLQHKWVMYYDSPKHQAKRFNNKNWQDERNHQKITEFATVEDFWCLYNNLVKASDLGPRSNYFLMKEQYNPEWEAVKGGGAWNIKLPKDENEMNRVWMYTLLAVIGESTTDGEDIVGVCLAVRNGGSRVEVWNKTGKDLEMCRRIGTDLRKVVELKQAIQYSRFADMERDVKAPILEA